MNRRVQCILTVLFLASFAPEARGEMTRITDLSHRGMNEISGIVRSESHPDVFWIHNDGGNPPRLFAIDAMGRTIAPEMWLQEGPDGQGGSASEWPGLEVWSATNVDWEDIAVDGSRLYVADMGNNANARKDLGVYVLEEPDPRVVRAARPLLFIPVAYPDQKRWPAKKWHYDCEAVFTHEGRLYFLTKHRKPGRLMRFESGADLYRLDTFHTDRTNILVKIGSHKGIELATAADISPSGEHLAILTYRHLWLFERPGEGDNWLSGHSRRIKLDRRAARQNEAIAWIDDASLLMANENRDLFRIDLSDDDLGAAPLPLPSSARPRE